MKINATASLLPAIDVSKEDARKAADLYWNKLNLAARIDLPEAELDLLKEFVLQSFVIGAGWMRNELMDRGEKAASSIIDAIVLAAAPTDTMPN